jgi:glycosyltransferase involved in cell wall biosynthesis
MRVLVLSHVPAYGSGSGIYAAKVAETLVQRGHEAALLTPAQAAYHVPDGVRLEWIGVPGHPGRWTFSTNFPTFSGHHDSPLLYDDLTEDQLRSYSSVVRTAIGEVAEEFRPDVIHVNHVFLLAKAVAELGRWPSVVLSHGSELLRPLGSGLRALQRQVLERTDVLAAVSRAGQEELARRTGRAPEQVALVPPGYDPDIFRPVHVEREKVLGSLGIDPQRPCAGYLGRLVGYKRVGDLLRAAALVPVHQRPNVLVMGDGAERQPLEELARQLGLDCVTFRPATHEPSRVVEVMNAVDVTVIPSENEPFPMAGIEAMACGTPVITTDQCGIADVVAAGPGAVYRTGDVQALSELLRAACAGDWKRDRGGLATEAVREFTWCNVTDALTALYQRAGRKGEK